MDLFGCLFTCVVIAAVLEPVMSKHSCEKITVPICLDVGYNFTYIPNMYNHISQEEAGLELHPYHPLVKVQCSPDLRTLICAAYLPVCMNNMKSIPPCRSLCQRAKDGCGSLMMTFGGFGWPMRLDCNQFPDSSECLDRDPGTGKLLFGEPAGVTESEDPVVAVKASPKKQQHNKKESNNGHKAEPEVPKRNRKQLELENLELDNERLKLSIIKLTTEEEKLQLEKQNLYIKMRLLQEGRSKDMYSEL